MSDVRADGKQKDVKGSPLSEIGRRWSLVGKIFRDRQVDRKHLSADSSGYAEQSSTVVFESFQLVKSEVVEEDNSECCWKRHWLSINANGDKGTNVEREVSVMVRHLTGPIMFEELLKFNNTGNVCVWPAEEVLAFYLLKSQSKFTGKSVIELGGGMTCLAGLLLAAAVKCDRVLLTDGSDESISNLQLTLERNSHLKTQDVKSRLLRWDYVEDESFSDLKEQFDHVISADCLFFDEFRSHLAHTIATVLKPRGEALIIAPKRGHSFDDFVSICRSDRFKPLFSSVEVDSHFDAYIYKLSEYYLKRSTNFSPSRHQPILIKLTKCS